TRPLSISPGGRPVTLTMHLSDDASANFGWRKLHTDHVGPLEPENPFPIDQRLGRRLIDATAIDALLGEVANTVAEVRTYGMDMHADEAGGMAAFVSGAPG